MAYISFYMWKKAWMGMGGTISIRIWFGILIQNSQIVLIIGQNLAIAKYTTAGFSRGQLAGTTEPGLGWEKGTEISGSLYPGETAFIEQGVSYPPPFPPRSRFCSPPAQSQPWVLNLVFPKQLSAAAIIFPGPPLQGHSLPHHSQLKGPMRHHLWDRPIQCAFGQIRNQVLFCFVNCMPSCHLDLSEGYEHTHKLSSIQRWFWYSY